MMRSLLAAVAALATTAFAQTTTDCNPLNKTCPADLALGVSNYTWNIASATSLDATIWNNTGGIPLSFGTGSAGVANFTITKSGNAPGVKSNFYYFFGTATVIMRASPGQGIISAMTSLSDDLDEIDFEWKGGNSSYVFTNFYGKYVDGMAGVGTDVKMSADPRADFHNYTTHWTNSSIQWFVDGTMVRELKSDDPSATINGTSHYPQTPMSLHIGSWAAGDASQPKGVQDWAGGATDYSKGPFTMSVASVYVSDQSTGKTYTYTDNSGSAASIKSDPGNSTIAAYLASPSAQSIGDSISSKVSSLSNGAKIGIACGALGGLALGILLMAICCVKQRRAGRKERALADADFQKQEAELMAYRRDQGQMRFGQMPAFGYDDKGRRY